MRLHICIFLAKLSIGSKEANSWTCVQFTRMERLCLEVLGILDNLLALHSSREFRLFTTPRWPETCMQSKSWSLASLTPLSHVPSYPAPGLSLVCPCQLNVFMWQSSMITPGATMIPFWSPSFLLLVFIKREG